MTINNNSNYVNLSGVHSATSSALQKVAAGLMINEASDDPSGLAISSQLGVQKSMLGQSIANANSGIAMSNIADKAISSQKDILENIKVETIKAMSGTIDQAGKEAIANQINQFLDQYNQIANSTTYNGQQLLTSSGDPTKDDISIVADQATVDMKRADTTSISDNIKSLMSDFTTNPDTMKNVLNAVDDGMDTLSSQQSNFASASNSLQSMARNYLDAQTNIANAQSSISDTNFSTMIAKLKQGDIQSQIGYMVQTQANAVQSRTVALLS